MKRTSLITTVVFLLFVAYSTFLLLSGSNYQCEVCILYNDTEVCQKVEGVDENETVIQGISTACGGAASGRTQNIECSNTPPKSVQCKKL